MALASGTTQFGIIMILISPYVRLSLQIDSLKSLADSLVNTQQIQILKLNSIGNLSEELIDEQLVAQNQLEALREQVQTISEYGVGFSDTAAHIAIPLTIALFAFAFPFLFTVISHINNKYESEIISKQFFSEFSYKWYLRGAAISAGYLVGVGLLSLIFKGPTYTHFMTILNWSSVVIAGIYSGIIVLFVSTIVR